ncbi:response regulator [Paludibaculum fermentans]|uniref:Response regulator n=1 Tax=Paludibaculum fermentans TaxID=1473598 RepID=A0A7S7NN84_PALFE|nr:response regulator [Paludibaculum fermentans]QOY86731.1 response regulator [Paludibaculum fermentans]
MDTKQTILIVDDSEFVRNYHSYILEQAEFRVVTAVDGSDGLEQLYTHSCDLVITDINMTNMDGYEFIRRVRANGKYRSLPIIIASTESDGKDKLKGFEAGANLYIVKPCAPEVMVENIRMILRAA